MFSFTNKTIFILSPQPWGKMHISKHHYAIELAKKGNLIYYFNPPAKKKRPFIKVENISENINIVSYSLFFPYILRFHFRKVYNVLLSIQIRLIQNKIQKTPDVVWNFDTNIFNNLKVFNSHITIYHPVDNITNDKNQLTLTQSADFIFSVSRVIIDKLKRINPKKKIYFINHGLSDLFLNRKSDTNYYEKRDERIRAYYVGNILIPSLDRDITKTLVEQNKNVDFYFIGSYNNSNNNLGGDLNNEAVSFIHFLKNQDNVYLKGVLSPLDISKELNKDADILLVLLDNSKDINKGSNSHKLLEYLSTGKVIVSSHISTYEKFPGLLEMVKEPHNQKLPDLFKQVVNNLNYYNSKEYNKKRIDFTRKNTYKKQIKKIERIINNNKDTE